MGDSTLSPMIGKRERSPQAILWKVLDLSDAFLMPDIHWNLVSVSLLGKAGVKIMFDLDKIVLTKINAFVGKGYCNQGLFMLNVLEIMNNKTSSSFAYIVDSYDV